jgi:hypothetical protein
VLGLLCVIPSPPPAYREQPDVLRQDVDRAVARVGDPDLELAGQVVGAVNRLLFSDGHESLAGLIHEEDLPVRLGAGPRRELRRNLVCDLGRAQRQLRVQIVERTAHRVAVHVSARAERRHAVAAIPVLAIQVADQGAQLLADHVVILHALARRQAQRAVREAVRRRVERLPLLG